MKTFPIRWYQQRRLRIVAGISLMVALVMLVLGTTLLAPYVENEAKSSLIWWGTVFCLVALAFAMAVFDLADLRRQLAAEKKVLVKTCLLDKKFLADLEEKIGEQRKQQEQSEIHTAAKDSQSKAARP